jgi:histidinol-phosphatase
VLEHRARLAVGLHHDALGGGRDELVDGSGDLTFHQLTRRSGHRARERTHYIPAITPDLTTEHAGEHAGDLALALELADVADAITIDRFRARDLVVETKPDRTPVTEADRAVETALRAHLARVRPDDAVVGEEEGVQGTGPRRWVVDPIDGTKSYLRGAPIWATLLALEVGDETVVGVVSAPAIGRRWWAARGTGAFANGEPIQVSRVHELADATIAFTDVGAFVKYEMWDEFVALAVQVWDRRGFCDFWGHMLVAEGVVDVMVEPIVNLWDVAPMLVIVEEAGGRITDRAGRRTADGGDAVTTNGVLHDAVLEIVGRPEPGA